MARYVYDDFRVTFTPRTGEEGHYDLRVDCTDCVAVAGHFETPPDAELEQLVLAVARSRTGGRTRRATPAAAPSVAVLDAPILAADAEEVEIAEDATRDVGGGDPGGGPGRRVDVDGTHLGTLLADALFAGDVGVAYRDALDRVTGTERGVRLTLSLGAAPKLLSIPWEFLRRGKLFLASQRKTPVVRLLQAEQRVAPPAIDDVVKVLAVIAGPKDLAMLDVAEEKARVEKAVAAVVSMGRVEVTWLESATRTALRHALRDSYHVLHYVGHSDFSDGRGLLFLETEQDHTKDAVDSEWLANHLADQRLMRLVVLNSCEGARTTLEDPYAGVATTLIQVGIPAVVAMQFEISDDVAILFAEELYANLIARQLPIDAAVAEARKAVYGDLDSPEFATPVLFVQDPDVALFDFRRDAEALPPTPAPGERGARTLPAELAAPLPLGSSTSTTAPPSGPAWRRSKWLKPAIAGAAATIALVGGIVFWPNGDAPLDYPTLELGADGVAVEAAQRLLVHHGAAGLRASGLFDHPTRDALIEFEGANDLPEDGILGPLTWSELVVPIGPASTASPTAVTAAQLLLNINGAEPRLVEDGTFGPRSHSATIAFERAHDLTADGIVDAEVWKRLLALAPPATITSLPSAAPPSVATAPAVDPDAPRPRSGFFAYVVDEPNGTHLITVDPGDVDAEPGTATNKDLAVDTDPVWDPATNRLAFSRAMPDDDGDIGVFYVVPGNGTERGKQVAPLVTGRDGSERLPQWSADGDLYFAATDGCFPGDSGCDDFLRLAGFNVTNEPPAAGQYLDGVVSLDTLTLASDRRVTDQVFRRIRAIAADPTRADRVVVADDDGLWLVQSGAATLVQPGLDASHVSFTPDGQAVVAAGAASSTQQLTVLDPAGAIVATVGVAELAATGTVDGVAVPAGGAIRTLSPGPDADGQVLAFIDDTSDAVPGVVVAIDAAAAPVITSATEVPPVVVALGRTLGVSI